MFRTPYNFDTNEVSLATGVEFPEPSLTWQDSRDECDINVIVERFGLTAAQAPTWDDVDVTNAPDLAQALQSFRESEELFLQLPARTRSMFDHSPVNLLTFLHDSGNRDEAIRLGLISAPVPEPSPVPPAEVPEAPTP